MSLVGCWLKHFAKWNHPRFSVQEWLPSWILTPVMWKRPMCWEMDGLKASWWSPFVHLLAAGDMYGTLVMSKGLSDDFLPFVPIMWGMVLEHCLLTACGEYGDREVKWQPTGDTRMICGTTDFPGWSHLALHQTGYPTKAWVKISVRH